MVDSLSCPLPCFCGLTAIVGLASVTVYLIEKRTRIWGTGILVVGIVLGWLAALPEILRDKSAGGGPLDAWLVLYSFIWVFGWSTCLLAIVSIPVVSRFLEKEMKR